MLCLELDNIIQIVHYSELNASNNHLGRNPDVHFQSVFALYVPRENMICLLSFQCLIDLIFYGTILKFKIYKVNSLDYVPGVLGSIVV